MSPPKRKPPKKTNKSEDEVMAQRNSANKRERQRTKELNEAFSILRRRIPSLPSDKMSKIHTLRIATEYIRFLDQLKRDGGKMFGIDLNADEKPCSLSTSFNIWRGSYSSGMNSCTPSLVQLPALNYHAYMTSCMKPIEFGADEMQLANPFHMGLIPTSFEQPQC